MQWSNKLKMIRMKNEAKTPGQRKELQDFILEHIDTFDDQAYDMLGSVIDLIPEEMANDIEFYKKLYPHIKKLDFTRFGLRPGMRLAMLATVCEERLNIS